MAIRHEDLYRSPGRVLAFPTRIARARADRARRAEFVRRRIMVASLVVLFAAVLLLPRFTARPAVSVAGAPSSVRISQGQTLWDLARRYAPADVDPRAYVDALIDLNDLDGGPRAGLRLKLPR